MDTNVNVVLTIFPIVTGIILAIAGILTYFIQRARYLREVEPDLDLKWPEIIRIGSINPSLKEFGSYYFDILITNKSTNHAYNLSYTVILEVFPRRGRSECFRFIHRELVNYSPKELLAGRSDIVPVYVGINSYRFDRSFKNHFYEWLQTLPSDLRIEDAGFFITITFEYFTKRDAALWFIIPFLTNRIKYHRTIQGHWGINHNAAADPPYTGKRWTFPNVNLDESDYAAY